MDSTREASVFLSVGHHLTEVQEKFVEFVREHLARNEFRVISLGPVQHDIVGHDPLSAIRDIIDTTTGTLVIATDRLRILSAIEYPGDKDIQRINERTLTTVWNQVEAAMTFQAHHPLLILWQDDLYGEGVLDRFIADRVHNASEFTFVSFSSKASLSTMKRDLAPVLDEWASHVRAVHESG